LTDKEYELITYMEMEYHLRSVLPTLEQCTSTLDITPADYTKAVGKPIFIQAVLNRGIKASALNATAKSQSKILSTEQMIAINTILDRNDTRSDKKKLADLGVNTQTYAGWQKDPVFKQYYIDRCEALFPQMTAEAHRALLDNVSRGDLGSIKLAYEMTGRWSQKAVGDLNIEFLLMRVIETISKHVTDPLTLSAIAGDLGVFADVGNPSLSLPTPTHTVHTLPNPAALYYDSLDVPPGALPGLPPNQVQDL
jgi:hypothetical protein